MDSAVAKFAGVDECRYFRDTDFPKYHFRQGESNPMLHFFGEWSKDERASTKMTSLSMCTQLCLCLLHKVECLYYRICEYYWQSN